jgi:uncharacterized protein (TIGR03000 family)
MIRRFMMSVGVPAVVSAALLLLAPPGMAQHGGGGHGGGGHGGGGHGGGGFHGGGGGGFHGGGGAYHGGGYYHDGYYRRGFYGGYPFGYGYYGGYPFGLGYWGGYYPDYYYDSDAYGYAGPRVYNYLPQYSGDYEPIYARDEFNSWEHADQRVMARIILPDPKAQLWIEGQEMDSGGATRSFVSPPLETGKYTYTFRARWSQGGQTAEQTKAVRVQPGDRITVDFTMRSMPESSDN